MIKSIINRYSDELFKDKHVDLIDVHGIIDISHINDFPFNLNRASNYKITDIGHYRYMNEAWPKIYLDLIRIDEFINYQLNEATDHDGRIELWKVIIIINSTILCSYNHSRFLFYLDLTRHLYGIKDSSREIDHTLAFAFCYLTLTKGIAHHQENKSRFLFDPRPLEVNSSMRRLNKEEKAKLQEFQKTFVIDLIGSISENDKWFEYKDKFIFQLKNYLYRDNLNQLHLNKGISLQEFLWLEISNAYKLNIDLKVIEIDILDKHMIA